MLPDRVSNPGPLTYESGALPIALRGPAIDFTSNCFFVQICTLYGNIVFRHTDDDSLSTKFFNAC